MAIVFTLLSMLMVCREDLCEKKAVSSHVEDALKTLVWDLQCRRIVRAASLWIG